MSEAPPRPSISPSSLVLNAPGSSLIAALEVVNRGGGRFAGTLESDVPWIAVEPRVVEENHVRVAVTIYASRLPEDQESVGRVTLRWGRLSLDVPVKVTRWGMARAWRLFEEGQQEEARELARSIAQTSGAPAAPLLLATSFLEEGNLTAAVRAIIDAEAALRTAGREGGALLEGPRARTELLRFLRAVEKALPQLRDARYCVGVLDELVERGVAARLSLEPVVLALLQAGGGLFVDDFPPSALGGDDLAVAVARVERMRREFPADERWDRWLARSREAPKAAEVLTEEAPAEARRPRVFLIAVILALFASVAVLMLWPRVRLHEAQVLLDGSRFEEALEIVRRVSEDGLETSDARAMRSRVHYEWAKTLFNGGEPGKGAEHLAIALHEDKDNPDMLAFKRVAYKAWADAALAKGRVTESYETLNELATMKPPDAEAVRRLESIRPLWRFYLVLDEIAARRRDPRQNRDAPTVPMDLQGVREAAAWGKYVRENHVAWYDARIQIAVVRLLEDGSDQLFVGGTDSTGRAGFHVYAPSLTATPALREIVTFSAPAGARFDHMQVLTLRRAPRQAGLLVDFTQASDPTRGQGVLVWAREGRLRQWSPPDCPTPLEVKEQDSDQPPLLLAKRAAGATLTPVAFRWMPAGPVEEGGGSPPPVP